MSEPVPPSDEPLTAAQTLAPSEQPTIALPGAVVPSVHDEATLPLGDQPTLPVNGQPATIGLNQTIGGARPDPGPTRIRYFGDYEIVKELARGGMGVVFQARQISLNRPVALKMILAGQLADDDAVRRFHLEAEAAANLDHPGIVPIYEVGEHEGQHFFSMGFIEGKSLAQRLAEEPFSPREAVGLMRKVADAIDHAHRHQVIHRDLKPGNILLDPSGNPRITDFGLAKKLETDSGLTGSGQVVGTPSYMPPEQAGGKRGEVGPAADIYALGATLYALVTGRPPFQASSVMDTLLMVIGEEPVSLRRLNASVPRDLEVICLKCLEKDPTRRYASAAALSDDLGRFLAGEPIAARPVGRLEKAWRWSKRNRLAASLISLVMLLTLAGTATITTLWLRAEASRVAAVASERKADRSKNEAVAASERAEANAATARRAVNDYLDRVTSNPQLKRPGMSGLRRDLLTQALTYYEGFLHDSSYDPVLRAEAADAQNRAAMILNELGDSKRAAEAARRAVSLNEQLVKEQPDQPAHRYRLGGSLVSLGNALRTTRNSDEAIAVYRRSAEISETALKDQPDNLDTAVNLGVAWSNLSKTLASSGKLQEADAITARSRKHFEDLVARVPEAAVPRDHLADVYHEMGDRASDRGEFEPARDLYLKGLAIREQIVREHPDDWWQLSQLGRIQNELGILHFHNQRFKEALPYYEKARTLRERLLAGEPASADLQEYLARSLDNLGNLHNSLGKPSEAIPFFERCIELRSRIVSASPLNAVVRGSLGGSLHNLAMSHEQLGQNSEAERLYREAMTHQRKAIEDQPGVLVHRSFLTNHLIGLANLKLRAGKLDEVAALADELVGLWPPQQVNSLMRSALFLVSCVGATESADTPEKQAGRDKIAHAAVSAMNKAIDGGVRELEFFKSNNQLDPIRDRDDFKKLLERLETLSAK